jgi:hypothetical protein
VLELETSKATADRGPQTGGRPSSVVRLANGAWLFEWSCPVCMDSGVVKSRYGYGKCGDCEAGSLPISMRVLGAVALPFLQNKPIDNLLFNMARALVSASSEAPILGEALASLLGIDARTVKDTAKRLKDEWRLPVIGRREHG